MRQSTSNIAVAQGNILAIDGHFVSVGVKVAKTSLTAALVAGVLPAGTLVTAAGVKATTTSTVTDAFGITLNDVDFNGSTGTEILPVVIHGFVKTASVDLDATYPAVEKAALNQIAFL